MPPLGAPPPTIEHIVVDTAKPHALGIVERGNRNGPDNRPQVQLYSVSQGTDFGPLQCRFVNPSTIRNVVGNPVKLLAR